MKEYKNKQGKPHRTDGPACEWDDGSKVWYINGELHRTDGPACEWDDGSKEWYINGQRHRTDGPAYEYADGTKEWWMDGELVYSDNENNISKFDISESYKRSIIKYELSK